MVTRGQLYETVYQLKSSSMVNQSCKFFQESDPMVVVQLALRHTTDIPALQHNIQVYNTETEPTMTTQYIIGI